MHVMTTGKAPAFPDDLEMKEMVAVILKSCFAKEPQGRASMESIHKQLSHLN
jgi:hypothetical protein